MRWRDEAERLRRELELACLRLRDTEAMLSLTNSDLKAWQSVADALAETAPESDALRQYRYLKS